MYIVGSTEEWRSDGSTLQVCIAKYRGTELEGGGGVYGTQNIKINAHCSFNIIIRETCGTCSLAILMCNHSAQTDIAYLLTVSGRSSAYGDGTQDISTAGPRSETSSIGMPSSSMRYEGDMTTEEEGDYVTSQR